MVISFRFSRTYVENIVIGFKNIAVLGEGIETTIIDGNQLNPVVQIFDGGGTAVLSHFTIKNGSSTSQGWYYTGGGIMLLGVRYFRI